MAAPRIDVERLKAGIDLRDLAGRLVNLRRESGNEASGACPHCGGSDRFHVKAGTFFCRQCYPLDNGEPHDAIEFVIWSGLAHDFIGAVNYLDARRLPSHGVSRRAAAHPAADPAAWRSPSWQEDARREMAAGVTRLARPEGEPGRCYLLARGLARRWWEAWGLGYGEGWDGALKTSRPAILIPWQGRALTAIKYRFLDDVSGGLRYSSRKGSQCIAFGLSMAGKHRSTLWLLEGELNCISLWQALRERYAVNGDVLSFGGESTARRLPDEMIRWAGGYRQVIIWADDPEIVRAAMQAIPGAFGLRSPEVAGRKLDANALLQLRPGALAEFALAAWDRCDRDPAYAARVQAEIDAAA